MIGRVVRRFTRVKAAALVGVLNAKGPDTWFATKYKESRGVGA
jgi:hypothetical protein